MRTALSPPAPLELRDVPASDPWETVQRGSRLISRKVGIIRQFAEARYHAQDPAVFAIGVHLADFSRCSADGQALTAAGAGDTAAAALVAAMGEAVERHCACSFDRDDLIAGTCRELADAAVSPDLLRLYSREQIEGFGPRRPAYFDDSSRIRWVWGHSLTARRPRLVPASLVYLNYRPAADEAHIGLNASTGLAAGATREEAILSGLLEIVERDAFTIAWMHRRPGRRVEVDDEALRQILRTRLWADRPGVDVKIFDLTTDVPIPVLFLMMRRRAECGPVVCLGAASRMSPAQAARKCVQEAAQNFPLLRDLLAREKHWQPAPDFSNVTTFDYHFLTYVRQPALVAPAFEFFDACTDRVALSRMPDRSTGRVLGDIEACIASLRARGHEVIAVDVTSPEVAGVGFSVVRVIVPGLVPLHGNHRRPFLGVRRLSDAAVHAGLNPFPHPFP